MKTKDILIFVFAVFVIASIGLTCYMLDDIQEKYNEEPLVRNSTTSETRYSYGLINDSLKLRTEYSLNKSITDSIITYNYISETDLSRSLKVDYNLNTEILTFDLGTEYGIDKFKVLSDSEGNSFDSYKMMDAMIDGVEPILFNKDYGILALTSVLNPSVFFVSKKDDVLLVKQIEEILYNYNITKIENTEIERKTFMESLSCNNNNNIQKKIFNF